MNRPAIVVVILLTAIPAGAQQAAPNLNRQQRAALQALVNAASSAIDLQPTADAEWPIHLLRASDGSHYVAFTIKPAGLAANQPVVLYVRLATRPDPRVQIPAERSALAEYLAGQRSTPRPEKAIAFGDMPTFGAGSIAARGPSPQSQSLSLLNLERERAREQREARERERKAELEGKGSAKPGDLLPFEDFDVRAMAAAEDGGAPLLRRSLTAGPGEYTLTVAWVDPTARELPAAVRVMKRAISLPAASTTDFALSSVIIADNVSVREKPFGAEEQTAHPYSIGTTEIAPSRDDVLTNDDRLAIVVQVINAQPKPSGKPDVAVGFRLLRITTAGQEQVGMLSPQQFNEQTLPADFDGFRKQPIFAAVGVPLRTFKRGVYRLQVLADDRVAGASTTTDMSFRIIGIPSALLRDAPALGAPFRRETLLEKATLGALVAALRPPLPSPALASALDAAREGRFVDLVRADAVTPQEEGIRTALRAIGLYALGDTPASLTAPLKQALQSGAPAAPVQIFLGATQAMTNNDRDAIAAWQAASDAGLAPAAVVSAAAFAHLRLGDAAGAAAVARAGVGTHPDEASLHRALAAALLATGNHNEALTQIEGQLARQPADADAQWLAMHALFAGFTRGDGRGATAAGQERLKELGKAYVAANGRHAALAAEWLAALP